jgi:hypothetical protein
VPAVATDFTPIANAARSASDALRGVVEQEQAINAQQRAHEDYNTESKRLQKLGQSVATMKPEYSFGTIAGAKSYNRAMTQLHASGLQREMKSTIDMSVQQSFFNKVNPLDFQDTMSSQVQAVHDQMSSAFGGEIPPEMQQSLTGVIDYASSMTRAYTQASQERENSLVKIKQRNEHTQLLTEFQKSITQNVTIENGIEGNVSSPEAVSGAIAALENVREDRQKEAQGWIDRFAGKNRKYIKDGQLAQNRTMAMQLAAQLLQSNLDEGEIAEKLDNLTNRLGDHLLKGVAQKISEITDPKARIEAHNKVSSQLMSSNFFDADRRLTLAQNYEVEVSRLAGRSANMSAAWLERKLEDTIQNNSVTKINSPELANAVDYNIRENASGKLTEIFAHTLQQHALAGSDHPIWSNSEQANGWFAAVSTVSNFQARVDAAGGDERKLALLGEQVDDMMREVERFPVHSSVKKERDELMATAKSLKTHVLNPQAMTKEDNERVFYEAKVSFNLNAAKQVALQSGPIGTPQYQEALSQNIAQRLRSFTQHGKAYDPESLFSPTGAIPGIQADLKRTLGSGNVTQVVEGLNLLSSFQRAYEIEGVPFMTENMFAQTGLNKEHPGAIFAMNMMDRGIPAQTAAAMLVSANTGRGVTSETFLDSEGKERKVTFARHDIDDMLDLFDLETEDNEVGLVDILMENTTRREAEQFLRDTINGGVIKTLRDDPTSPLRKDETFTIEQGLFFGFDPEDIKAADFIPGIKQGFERSKQNWFKLGSTQAIEFSANAQLRIKDRSGGHSIATTVDVLNDIVSKKSLSNLVAGRGDGVAIANADKVRLLPMPGGRLGMFGPTTASLGMLVPINYKDGTHVIIDPAVATRNSAAIKSVVNRETATAAVSMRSLLLGAPGESTYVKEAR